MLKKMSILSKFVQFYFFQKMFVKKHKNFFKNIIFITFQILLAQHTKNNTSINKDILNTVPTF